ncbi:hypothetical protein HXX76_013187 [Chlamydomonas incerta]|uniref:O-fucosyltransferase family protein n=1 Tax=Chlamydomonas incerta TaxID=51695 RepID=A0A835VV24_CHLIN|nr:hypothetical protein HXX76_013187 [Chlamydomonas incerta]|eukprot:KAG2426206.1 hypothetical protein HXX76_013187 [Chlamydomonas incerta]
MRAYFSCFLILVLLVSTECNGAEREGGGDDATAPLYIVPVLWHGPNNQITTIKEAISLAYLLTSGGRKRGQASRRAVVAIPDLQEHKFSDGGVHFMFAAELFDLGALAAAGVEYVPLAQLRGLAETGGPAGQGVQLAGKGLRRHQQAQAQAQQRGQVQEQEQGGQGREEEEEEEEQGRGRQAGQRRRMQREDGEAEQPDEAEGGASWDGRLDAVLFFRDTEFPPVQSMLDDMGVGLQAPRRGTATWLRSPISVSRGCSAAQVEELRALLQPYRYVAMLSYDDFALQTHKLAGTLLSDCGEDLCCEAYKVRSPLFHKSERIYGLAEDFVGKAIGKDKPFMAAHIRPMPDPCVVLWQSADEDLDPKELEDTCRTDFMYYRLVPNMQWLIKQHQHQGAASAVFIMTHPTIRPRVFRMLKAGGIDPIFIDMAQFNASVAAAEASSGSSSSSGGSSGRTALRTPVSNSLLAMVEEAVAAMATVFLGTAESSMTGMIVQERLTRGLPPESTFFMSPHPNCTVAPCALRDYYTRRAERLAKQGTLKAMQP